MVRRTQKTLKCSKCSEAHPSVIDFHHKNGKQKETGIAEMITNGRSIERIRKEIDKCQVVCSNCHRKIHYKQKL